MANLRGWLVLGRAVLRKLEPGQEQDVKIELEKFIEVRRFSPSQ